MREGLPGIERESPSWLSMAPERNGPTRLVHAQARLATCKFLERSLPPPIDM